MFLNWIKSSNNEWHDLYSVNLANQHFDNMEGVYVIWHRGNSPNVVRVGQGIIRDRLSQHRDDPQIRIYLPLGLLVTWASVPNKDRDGVEAYLAQQLRPAVGERFPSAIPTVVNLPSRE